MNQFLLISLTLSIALLLSILFIIDYVKNTYQFEILLEHLFRTFLRMEKTSLDLSKNFYFYLCKEVGSIFFSKLTLFFLVDDKSIHLESASIQDENLVKQLKFNIKDNFEIKKSSKLNKIKAGMLPEWLSDSLFLEKKLALLLPIYHDNKLTAIFVFSFNYYIPYFRANKRMALNSKKLKEVINDIIAVIKEKQQDIYSMMLGSIKDYAFMMVDEKLLITSWNRGAEIMFGYDSNEVLNKNINTMIDKKSIPEFNKALDLSEKKEEIKTLIRMRDFTNTVIITEFVLKRIVIDHTFSGYYIMIKDITKEEIWKNNIKKQSMINKSIVENARDGILLLDEDNRIIYLNEKLNKIIGTGFSNIGREVKKVFNRELGEKIETKIQELRESGMELTFLNIKQVETWYNIRFFPVKNQGQMEGIIIFFIDNTYVMKTREKLEEMNQSLLENLQTAKLMHLSLIPSSLPDNQDIQFQSIFLPSDEVGGDFYHVDELELDHKKYYITMMADVSGHGVGASMLTVLVKDVYSDFINSIESESDVVLSRFLKMLNKKIINLNMNGSKFVTVYIAFVDLYKKVVKYSSAGHPHAALLRLNKKIDSFGLEKSPPVGIIDEFDYQEDEKPVKKNDKICIYSDGILDIFENEVELFNQFINKNKKLSILDIRKEIENQIIGELGKGKYMRVDDITIVLFEIY